MGIFTIILILASFFANAIQAGEIVSTIYGQVQGSTAMSRDGRLFHQFLGIPYAKAERFQPPTNPDSWSDIKNASAYQPVCPQVLVNINDSMPVIFSGTEDCLNLNVFTPALPHPDKAMPLLPVMIWFHGGGSEVEGAANYDPQYYMDTDIVVVTFDSRLGFLGYLNLGNELASGNQRLKDQVLMLKWVQKNIENFGGDPARVTLNGIEAGAAEVSYHIISPMSKGLFAGAISQCGSPLMPNMFIHNPIYQAKQFGKKVGCPVEDRTALFECLKGKKTEDLVLPFHRWFNAITDEGFLKAGPSIEHVNSENTFMTENPFLSIKEKRVSNEVPWLFTVGFHTGFVPYIAKLLASDDANLEKKLNSNIRKILPMYLDYEVTASDPDIVTQKILDEYFDGGDINEGNIFQLVHLITYRFFSGPSIHTGNYNYSSGHSPMYALMIKYVPTYSIGKTFGYNGVVEGAAMDDESYQFPWKPIFPGIDKTSKDYILSKNLIGLLSSFIENGKPTETWGDFKDWQPYDFRNKSGASIDEDGGFNAYFPSDVFKRSYAFFAKLYKNELASEFQNPTKETF